MSVQAFTFSQYHNKHPIAGSTFIRIEQMMKYWPEFTYYRYGEFPEALIFQKVYISDDYDFPKYFENIKILDICDPDWIEGHAVVTTAHSMDAIVVPTEPLAAFMRQFHKLVKVIPDRFDVDILPPPKHHEGKAKTVVWFGYSHNAENLKPAIPKIEALGLKLIVISDDDPIANRWGIRDASEYYKFIKYDESTIYDDLLKADFAVLPEGVRPRDIYKSNNKTIKANLVGLPVAKTSDEITLYMEGEERQKWLLENHEQIKSEYDIRRSIDEYKELIDEIKGLRNG